MQNYHVLIFNELSSLYYTVGPTVCTTVNHIAPPCVDPIGTPPFPLLLKPSSAICFHGEEKPCSLVRTSSYYDLRRGGSEEKFIQFPGERKKMRRRRRRRREAPDPFALLIPFFRFHAKKVLNGRPSAYRRRRRRRTI